MTSPNPNFSAPVPGAQGPVPGAPVSKTKWIVQLVVGVVCLGNPITLVLAIIGLVKADTDLPLAEKLYKWGWIAYAICVVLWLIYIGLNVAALIAMFNSGSMDTY
ncbi:hypothetical protein [Brachybacterium kimchii]|uniref:Uncharacterized protein n=1 Tax=Brachybacterium kimchii TaxID=2942909 RepID=A0ABY4N691_9MICO|nr:hypothetical protein [Brachybacterium kimchii]UQN29634.1 hypothetical protein M4486_18705 [Brachybacterium kimchii]